MPNQVKRMMLNDFLAEIVDGSVIENCASNGACCEGLNWLCEKPRTFGELRAKNDFWWLWLANNVSLPAVLEKLAGDSDTYVRRIIADNPSTPSTVLEKLAGDSSEHVRMRVERHPNTPAALREKLRRELNA